MCSYQNIVRFFILLNYSKALKGQFLGPRKTCVGSNTCELFDLRNIYVLSLKTGHPPKIALYR